MKKSRPNDIENTYIEFITRVIIKINICYIVKHRNINDTNINITPGIAIAL